MSPKTAVTALFFDKELDFKTRNILCVPLKFKNRILGSLEVINKKRKRMLRCRRLRALTVLANHVATAIENSRLYREAMTDALTGLYSRRFFQNHFRREFIRSARVKGRSRFLCDLDDFKEFNDTYGHQAGDRALKAVAAAMRATLRRIDVAARYGGEEFVTLLHDTDKNGAMIVAERMREAIQNKVIKKGNKEFPSHAP